MTDRPVRVRFAPSPTGHLHIGGARTALFNYLFARKTGGQFILRIEDTDRKRFVPGAEQEIIEGLRWLGLEYDEGPDIGGPYRPYRQTERLEIYRQRAWELVERSAAYPCFCTPERLEKLRQEQMRNKQQARYDGLCRDLDPDVAARRVAQGERYVIRFKMPRHGVTIARDHLRGEIVTENQYLDDYVLLKSDGFPTYHLAAMVDDHEMKITHVFRGSEWLSTFPLHVQVVRAFGWEEPVWIHLSVFLKPSGKGKMSKRESAETLKDGYSIFVKDMKELGFIPEGVLNWISLMGWGVPEDDVMTLEKMIERFEIDSLTPSPAAINFQKLDHFNRAHIRRLSTEDLARRIKPYFLAHNLAVDDDQLLRVVPLLRERLVTLDDCLAFGAFFFSETVEPAPEELIPKGLSAQQAAQIARRVYAILEAVPDMEPVHTEPPLRAYVEESGFNVNQVFGLVRVAVTGQRVSPPLFESMAVIGREKVLERLKRAGDILESMS